MRWLFLVVIFYAAVGCRRSEHSTAPGGAVKGSGATESTPTLSPSLSQPPLARKPVAAFPPDEWTHKELAGYLGQKGVTVTVHPIPFWSTEGRIAAQLNEGLNPSNHSKSILTCLCRDTQAAKDQAGSMGLTAFAVGDSLGEFLHPVAMSRLQQTPLFSPALRPPLGGTNE